MVLNYVLLSFSTWNSSNSVPFSPPYLWPIWKIVSFFINDWGFPLVSLYGNVVYVFGFFVFAS